jgi:CheY-like chemotaxis protein
MGGEIAVTSEPGRGTTFRIALLPAAELPAALEARPRSVSGESRRASVMIVEDESSIRVVLARALRDHDLTILTNVPEALVIVSSGQHFDLILSDLMLPEVTGMDFYDEVRRSNPELAERIVFVTGGASTPAVRAFLDRVPNERMEKPFTVQAIRALVRRLVTGRETTRPSS